MKIQLSMSVAGKDENGRSYSWQPGDEVDCETAFAKRLIEKGWAVKIEAKPTATRKKSVKVQ